MANPTISITGTASGLFLITDQDGVIYRVPMNSVSSISDTSNSDAFRLEVLTPANAIVLIFDLASAKNAFIATMDSQY